MKRIPEHWRRWFCGAVAAYTIIATGVRVGFARHPIHAGWVAVRTWAVIAVVAAGVYAVMVPAVITVYLWREELHRRPTVGEVREVVIDYAKWHRGW